MEQFKKYIEDCAYVGRRPVVRFWKKGCGTEVTGIVAKVHARGFNLEWSAAPIEAPTSKEYSFDEIKTGRVEGIDYH